MLLMLCYRSTDAIQAHIPSICFGYTITHVATFTYMTFSFNWTDQLLFIVLLGQTSLCFLHSSFFLTDDPMMTVHMMVAKEQHSVLPHVLSFASLERTCHQTMIFSQVLLICFIHNMCSWFWLSCKCREKSIFLKK